MLSAIDFTAYYKPYSDLVMTDRLPINVSSGKMDVWEGEFDAPALWQFSLFSF